MRHAQAGKPVLPINNWRRSRAGHVQAISKPALFRQNGGSPFQLETRKNRVISGEAGWFDDVEASGRKNGIVRSDFHDAWRCFRRFGWLADRVSPCIPGVRGRSGG
ncbi:hypothetical protein [Sphingobium sp. LB126]|uniref:hypothetical protein n=1 Tax=Sphingobium sp. LB126 TaxID=1983755 RepID=UPI0012FE324E|nr:hypothetical protein [Sphingobium sp. LB126]